MPDEIIGASPALRKIRAAVPHLAAEPKPIVIVGETGVGKFLVASHLHSQSPFRSSQLEVINFNILSDREKRIALLGGGISELTTTRRSLLELPTTVVLKNVDLTDQFLQENLAQFLKSRQIVRPGIEKSRPLASRIIFTFIQTVSNLFRAGRIIPQLFGMLRSYKAISIPPLRKRKEDIPLLAEHFLHQFYDKLHSLVNGQVTHVYGLTDSGSIEPSLSKVLVDHPWETNVLQLKAFIHSLITYTYGDAILQPEKIEVSKMLLMLAEGREFSLRQSISIIEDAVIERAIKKYDGHQQKAAQMLGLTGRSIRRRNISRSGL